MPDLCVLFDLPTCLTRQICSVWIGGNKEARQGLGMKTLLRLDSAVCNKQLRHALFDFFYHLDWETWLAVCKADYSGLRMRWVVGRRILLPKLVLSHFPNDVDTIRSFFKFNGAVLKVLKLSDFKGAMTQLTKAIASDCTVLETLFLERCNLTMSIVGVLNKTTSIKEVRFQNRLEQYDMGVKVALFEKVVCPSVIKLALLDSLHSEDADVIARAFPNVNDFEMHRSSGDALVKLLRAWKCVESLFLTDIKEVNRTVLSEIVLQVQESLKTVLIEDTNRWNTNFAPLLLNCGNLTSVTLVHCYRYWNEPLLVARLAKNCNVRLEVLNVGGMQVMEDDIAALAEHCPNLRVLNMHHIGYCANYELLLCKCTRLEKLRVALLNNFTISVGQQITAIAALFTTIAKHCSHLRHLSLFTWTINAAMISALLACTELRVFETSFDGWKTLIATLKGVEVRHCDFYSRRDKEF